MTHRKKTLAQQRLQAAGSPRSLCGRPGYVSSLTRKTTCRECLSLIEVLSRGRSMMRDAIPTPAALAFRLASGLPVAPQEGAQIEDLNNQTQRSGGVADA